MRTALSEPSQKVTPPQLAKRWRVSPKKVVEFIELGELPAINLARSKCTRPRYAIDEADIAAFELGRRVTPPAATAPRLRRPKTTGVRNYFA